MTEHKITVTEAAKTLGVSAIWARELCRDHGIGELITSRLRLLSAADVAKLRRLIGGKRRATRMK